MKSPKVEIVYDYKHQATNTNPGTVWIRVYFSRTSRKYISTGVRVCTHEWNDEYKVVTGRNDAVQLNSIIKEQIEKCRNMVAESIAEEKEEPTTRQMKVDRSEASFLRFMEKEINYRELGDKTRCHHYTVLRSLEDHGKIKRFENVNQNNIRDWICRVKQKTVKRLVNGKYTQVPICQAAVYNYFKILKVYVRIAIGYGYLPANCMYGIDVPKGKDPKREHLTNEEIEKWCSIDIKHTYLQEARDRFIVQMGTGLAYGDLVSVDFTSIETIDGMHVLSGNRKKTDENYFIVILDMAYETLQKWDFVVPHISDQKYNEYLKVVAKMCGIKKKITSHVARHTYACKCLADGVRIEAVQRTLGHKKISTTQIYAKLVDMDVLEAFKVKKQGSN